MIRTSARVQVKQHPIGTFIGIERTARNLTQEKLAAAASVNESTIKDIERYERVGRVDTLVTVLEALGYDLLIVPRK